MIMTKRLWKNRIWIKKELKGKVTLESLTILKEKRINMIRELKNERRNKVITMKTRKANHTFDQDPGKFYGRLRDILNQDKDKEKPKYEENRSSNHSKQSSSLTKEDFEKFWVPIWQNDQEVNLTLMNEGVVSKETVVLRRWGSSIQKIGFINGVDNVNWPPYRDSKS